MSAQPPGRRTESLFDNRYRYDYIYPRGRSGETLRAYDTRDGDRPVVIKRPAPQDAPPMRAGQEVSIRTEKQALERLAGHPVLTELRGSGTFRIGGHTHDYIVMDLAQGAIVESLVLELAEQERTLPELEILVIVDNLLDLLAFAHNKQVVYNDVDAKHLFWDRENYRLKVIDWGNAVFLDEPGALPNITRTTDVHQVGELLFFILTGGNRLAVDGEDGESFFVNFGPDAEHIAARLQAIVTRAVHPDPRRRFGSILELRHALTEYRQPLEKTRDDMVSRVRKRVRPTASQEELESLLTDLQEALAMDPGFPAATTLAHDIAFHLRQIHIQADLDAIRIYLESGNWPRAFSLLQDLLQHVDEVNEPLVRYLIAAASLLEELQITPPPDSFLNALDPLFKGDAPASGQLLLSTSETRTNARLAQWLLAEQLAAHVPSVVLLRPHLVRVRHLLQNTPDFAAVQRILDGVERDLSVTPLPGLTGLQVIYQEAAAALDRLQESLNGITDRSTRETASASVERARHAANEISDRLEELGHYVFGDAPHARDLLARAAMIDPTSPHFDTLKDYFEEVRQAIAALTQFKPRNDGVNLAEWFADVQDFLAPYLQDLSDEQLHSAASAVQHAAEGWTTVINSLALGRHQPTIDALRDTADTIRPINEQIAAWLGTLANRLPDVPFTERLSPNAPLADKLIEGLQAWDQGDGLRAIECGRQAYDLATTDGERLAANRLKHLGEILDRWLAEDGQHDTQRTDRAETQALAVLLSEEEHERQTFAAQMPNTTLYLRAMSRELVAYMRESSSAGWRALYLHYAMRGILALLDDDLDEADFWRNAAEKCAEGERTHRVFQILDRGLTARRLVQRAQQALSAVSSPQDLDGVRSALNAPLAGDVLVGAQQAVELITDAVQSWTDGDFYAARQALDGALNNIQRTIEAAPLDIERFVTWVTMLRDTAADLHQKRLLIEQGAATTGDKPDPALAQAHADIVAGTLNALGPDHAHQVRQWEDTYQAVLDTYVTQRLNRREKLAAFNRHFAGLFITRHPAYPLFRHWETLTQHLPPDEVEDEMITIEDVEHHAPDASPAFLLDDQEADAVAPADTPRRSELPWNWIIAVVTLALIVAAGLAVMHALGGSKSPATVETGQSPTADVALALPGAGTQTALVPPAATTSPAPTKAPAATATVTPLPPTFTPTTTAIPPSATPTLEPTEPVTPSLTPTLFLTSTLIPTRTPAPVALAPQGSPITDLLIALAALPADNRPGPANAFVPGADGTWLLSGSGSSETIVSLPPDLLSVLLQPGASNTLRRADAVFELLGYDQAALANGNVAFGLGAENSDGQSTIGQVQLAGTSLIRLGMNQNGRFRPSTEFPQQNPQVTLSVRRSDASTLSFFVDDRWLGDSVFLFPQGEPVTLILLVSGQGVQVRVSAFSMDYSPRDEIP